MTRVAILSDTHGKLSKEVIDVLKTCQRIIHAGDFASLEIAKKIEAIAPSYMVRGNNDFFIPWGQLETAEFQIENVSFYMIHNLNYLREEFVPEETNVLIYGHTHQYTCTQNPRNGIMMLNPGSVSRPRGIPVPTMAVMTIEGSRFSVEKIEL